MVADCDVEYRPFVTLAVLGVFFWMLPFYQTRNPPDPRNGTIGRYTKLAPRDEQ